jgi:hypothetical protein
MSKVLSLKLDEKVFLETERTIGRLKKPRNAYINEAVDFYNKHNRRFENIIFIVRT